MDELEQMGLVIVKKDDKKVVAKLKDVKQALKISELTKQAQTLLQNDQTLTIVIARSGNYIIQKVITKNSTTYEIRNGKNALTVDDVNALEKAVALIKKLEGVKA